jgi:hypothetical protein
MMVKTKLVFLICLNVSMVVAGGCHGRRSCQERPSGYVRVDRRREKNVNKIPEEIWKVKQANEDNVSHAESDYSLQSDNNESEREEEDSRDLGDEEDKVMRRIKYGDNDEEEDGSFNQYYKSDGDRACANNNEDAKNVSEDELESFDDEGSKKNLQSEQERDDDYTDGTCGSKNSLNAGDGDNKGQASEALQDTIVLDASLKTHQPVVVPGGLITRART